MLQFSGLHHVAIICSDYTRSKKFYTEVLGLEIINETFRSERNSFKLDLAIKGNYVIELFSFPDPPLRPSRPEATGLRHLAFSVTSFQTALAGLHSAGIATEEVRTDTLTGKSFTFFTDPDGLPLELYEI